MEVSNFLQNPFEKKLRASFSSKQVKIQDDIDHREAS